MYRPDLKAIENKSRKHWLRVIRLAEGWKDKGSYTEVESCRERQRALLQPLSEPACRITISGAETLSEPALPISYYVICTRHPACTGKDCTARSHAGKIVLHLQFENRRNWPDRSSLASGWVYWAPGAVLGWALVLGSSNGVSVFCEFPSLDKQVALFYKKIKNLVQKKRCDSRIFGLCYPLYAGDDKETTMLFIQCPWCHWHWGISRQNEAQLLL